MMSTIKNDDVNQNGKRKLDSDNSLRRIPSYRGDFKGLYTMIPSALIAVAPFLEEGLHIIRKATDNGQEVTGIACILALTCFKHAFAFLHTYNIALDASAENAIKSLKGLAEQLATVLCSLGKDKDLAGPIKELKALLRMKPDIEGNEKILRKSKDKYRAMVIAEAKVAKDLADKLWVKDFRTEAAKQYHTVCIYLRMVGPLTSELEEMLSTATIAIRKCGTVAQNLIHENFGGIPFASKYADNAGSIGEGAFGAVHTCVHRVTGDEFACKLIGLTSVKPYNIHVLHSEIQIMKVLDHPNIVKLREVFFEPQRVYLVMDLCNGGDLKNYLKNYGVQNDLQVSRMLSSMIRAVLYLHQRGIVHRDLKLENFVFESTSRDSPLKLIDFGLSKYLDESEHLCTLVGTPYYIAPEVWNDKYDEKCDHWALGVCAYTLLVGEFPFNDVTVEGLKMKIKYAEPSYTHFTSRPNTESFLKILLNKNPSERAEFSACFLHPFMSHNHHSSSSINTTPNTANSLLKYLHMSETRKLLLKAVGFCLSPAQIAKLKRGFEEIDENRNGVICVQELKTAIERQYSQGMHFSFSQEEMREMFANVDQLDSNMEFNYSEFLAAALHRQLVVEEERLKEAFTKLDPHRRGYLTREDVKLALGHMTVGDGSSHFASEVLIDDKLNSIFEELDTNRDGIIEYYEFLQFWRAFNEKTRSETMGLQPPKKLELGTFGGIGLFKSFKEGSSFPDISNSNISCSRS